MTDPVSAAERSSVLIAGGGLAGLSLAVAFKTALGRGFAVHIVDPAIAAPPADQGRASAFAAVAALARRLPIRPGPARSGCEASAA